MNLKLIVAKGQPKGKEIEVTKDQTVVGRDPECDLVIASPKVSRKHCQIAVRGNAASLTDLGSRNGTFVNGQKAANTPLKAGDKVVIGPMGFIVEIDGDRGRASASDAGTPKDIQDFLANLEKGGGSAGA